MGWRGWEGLHGEGRDGTEWDFRRWKAGRTKVGLGYSRRRGKVLRLVEERCETGRGSGIMVQGMGGEGRAVQPLR